MSSPQGAAVPSDNKKEKKKTNKPQAQGAAVAGKSTQAGLVPRDLPSVLKSRFFVIPSFDIYGGVNPLYTMLLFILFSIIRESWFV